MVYGLAALLVVSSAVPAAAGEVEAGVGRETFTLPKHVPLAGYSRRKGRPSQGLHDPVGVRALVIREGATTAALASCDLLIIDERLFDAVRRRAIEGGLPPDTLFLIAATHTHSGPGAYGARFLEKHSMGHFDPDIFEAIADAIAQALLQAYRTMSPVRAAFRSSQTHGLLENRVDAGAGTDNELTVYAVYRHGEARPMAVLVGFAAHPTTLGAWNWELSADYPGVVMREVERQLPSATCLFFAGAAGDQAPVKHGTGFEAAESLGQQLAAQVAALLDRAVTDAPQQLLGVQEDLPLPPARVRVSRVTLPQWLSARLVDDDASLSLVAVGGTVFLGVPCDLTVSLGHVLKDAARSHGLQPVIVGFANDYIGYCVPETLYEQDQYESSMAFNGPKTGELIVQRLTEMIGRLVISDQ
ncbi:MAG: neutral/alkaline non-lysosomal ceramidase N-terminal domain-containing protein [Candidatus Omnitrophica bacterium]|nr:neutral/alkaline non-lysosomal ceramidase N-terminal domain-containing protein [Candidatus Omnitrophota bacterium]